MGALDYGFPMLVQPRTQNTELRTVLLLFQGHYRIPRFLGWWRLEVLITKGEIKLRGPVFACEINTLLECSLRVIPRTGSECRQPLRKDRAGFSLSLVDWLRAAQ